LCYLNANKLLNFFVSDCFISLFVSDCSQHNMGLAKLKNKAKKSEHWQEKVFSELQYMVCIIWEKILHCLWL